MSRLADIRTAVGAIVSSAFTVAGMTVTLVTEPIGLDKTESLPIARLLFGEEPPEQLDFRQERRRVVGQVALGLFASDSVTRETVDALLQAIRDGLYADPTLTDSVDYVVAEAGRAHASADSVRIYGVLDVATEEVF